MKFLRDRLGTTMAHWRSIKSEDKEAMSGWLILMSGCLALLVLIYLSYGKII